jgi:hypothetical protein
MFHPPFPFFLINYFKSKVAITPSKMVHSNCLKNIYKS